MFNDFPDVMDIVQASKALGISKGKLYSLVRENQIQHIRIGKKIKITKNFLVDYIASLCYDGCATNGADTAERST